MTDFISQVAAGKKRFRNLEITDLDCSGLDALELELHHCSFRNVRWHNALLEGLHSVDSTFSNCDFSRAHLSESIFERTSFYGMSGECIFSHADLTLVQFLESDLRMANFEKTRLFQSKFIKSNATGANFSAANFRRVATIVDCNFRMVDLRDADLRDCDLHKTIFEQADLSESNFERCNLTECDFAGANLIHLQIKGADLRGANITAFDVRATDFTDVTIYEAQAKVLLENLGITLVEQP